jgi:hypothetical protein
VYGREEIETRMCEMRDFECMSRAILGVIDVRCDGNQNVIPNLSYLSYNR